MNKSNPSDLKLYYHLASWWPLLSPPEDYAEEAAFYRKVLDSSCEGECRTLLELGSGGGNNAFYLKHWFELTLADRSHEMLEISRGLNPECEHVTGDMRTLRMDRRFDAVFVHDAINYMSSATDLRRVMETAYAHCRPGGAALFAPDYVTESFRPGTDTGGHDGKDRGLRYLEWRWDPDPTDSTYTVDYAFLLREADGSIRVEHDRHIEGLFAREEWLRVMSHVGFLPEMIPFQHTDLPGQTMEVFTGKRPG